jgi:hypothetical protein
MISQRFMTHPAGDCATGLVLHEETNAILLEVLLFESLERHCCSSPEVPNILSSNLALAPTPCAD